MGNSEGNTSAAAAGVTPAAEFRAAPWIAHERLDDEVMAIDLESGVYYALDDVAADAWTLLAGGVGVGHAAALLAERYEVDPDRAHADLVDYAMALERDRLLVRGDDVATGVPAVLLPEPTRPLEYTAPTVSRYDDLEALLKLDPVHEVDEAGWPVPRAD
jgi:hypothetical protein